MDADLSQCCPTQNVTPFSRWSVLGVLLIALLIRGGVLIVGYENLQADPDAYREFAQNLVKTRIYGQQSIFYSSPVPSAYRPPLYPLVLSHCILSQFGTQLAIALTHLALGMATVGMTLLLGRQLGLGRWSYAAALLVTADPILLHQSTLVMTETLAAFLATVALYSLNRYSTQPCHWHAGIAGGSLALAALCRPVFLVTMALVALAMLFGSLHSKRRASAKRLVWITRAGNVAAFTLIVCLVLSPWVIRNWRVLERPIIATTHGGYTFELGNNESFYSYLQDSPWGSTWDASEFNMFVDMRPLGPCLGPNLIGTRYPEFELQQDARSYEEALQAIRENPSMFTYACLVRNGRLWQLAPHQLGESESTARRAMRYAVGLWYLGLFSLMAVGCLTLWKARRKNKRNAAESRAAIAIPLPSAPWLWGFLMIASFMLVHTFYWTNMRMRAPLMPFVSLLAALGLAIVFERINKRSSKSSAK